ncbi:MAG TPA: pseudouridine synthase [Bacteroidia bacterium]|nr:pseudouridine synthase [Bacteroidia bacterium]
MPLLFYFCTSYLSYLHKYFIIHKPFGMLSQFSKEGDHKTLADINFHFQKDIYPVGRLDADSEGLLLLTNDKSVNHQLLNPKFSHNRTYIAQVEGLFSDEAKSKLEKGVLISVDGKQYKTLTCKVKINPYESIDSLFPPRNPPIRFRKNIPTSWIEINLHEGKNRQVRKMTAAVGFPTLRLIRTKIENIELKNLQPGKVEELKKEMVLKNLK